MGCVSWESGREQSVNRHGADEETSTGHGRCVGRLAGLAVALGIGAALAAAPWVASAAPSSASANAPGQNHAVSTQGVVREQRGTATASSIDAPGSVAIATGANSKAISTCRNCRAEVNGAGSAALASGTSDNTVIVKGDKSFGIVDAGDSTGNRVHVTGNGSQATVFGDSSKNNLTIDGDGSIATTKGTNNTVTIKGNKTQAAAENPDGVKNSTVKVTGDNLGPVVANENNQTIIVPPKG